jgi:predicted DNA-binding transcriptional regulator AlpA
MIDTTSNQRRMLRTEDAANYTGLSASTLNKLRLSGDGPSYIKIGKSVVYDPTDLDEWLSTKRRRSTSVAA